MNLLLRDELAAILEKAALPEEIPFEMPFDAIDVSPRARSMRSILRIARSNGWEDAITLFLETKGVSYLSDLNDVQLEDLLDRMRGYVDAAEMGCSLPDCLPAY